MQAWTIVYHSHTYFLHEQHIRASNPGAQLLCLETANALPHPIAVRAGDRLVRRALQRVFNTIQHNNILVIAWDVLLTMELPNVQVSGVVAPNVPTLENAPTWMWWREVPLLPSPLRRHPMGVVPFCVFAIDRASLWKILDPRFDELFERDILSELRFGSLCSLLEIPIGRMDESHFPNERILSSTTPGDITEYMCRFGKEITTVPGLYHPVKFRIPLRGE
jgi:hypothetical protein